MVKTILFSGGDRLKKTTGKAPQEDFSNIHHFLRDIWVNHTVMENFLDVNFYCKYNSMNLQFIQNIAQIDLSAIEYIIYRFF